MEKLNIAMNVKIIHVKNIRILTNMTLLLPKEGEKEKSDGSVCFFACVVVELQMFDNLTLKKKSTSDRAVQRKSGW